MSLWPSLPLRARRSGAPTTTVLVALALLAPAVVLTQDTLPARLADREFWSLIEGISEPDRGFRTNSGSTDNLLSNENEVSMVAATVGERVGRSGVYLGVGPEQNFTYIATMQPRIAFIVDIRRGNLLLHLMYKALFELSSDRADFVARLFSRGAPPELSASSTAAGLMGAMLKAPPVDARAADAGLEAISTHLTRSRNLPLSADDLAGIAYVYRSFQRFGPGITFTSSTGIGASGHTYAQLMALTDGAGVERSYLATESSFAFVKDLHRRNLIVPVVGDFAGPKALVAIGTFLRGRGAMTTAFYVSNVESYLRRDGTWPAFCKNVAALPVGPGSVFIRPGGLRVSVTPIEWEIARC